MKVPDQMIFLKTQVSGPQSRQQVRQALHDAVLQGGDRIIDGLFLGLGRIAGVREQKGLPLYDPEDSVSCPSSALNPDK
jgi:hypothetical protein